MAPTAWNACPMRVLFVSSKEAKAKLQLALTEGSKEKVASAPVTAIIAHDLQFYTQFEKISPRMVGSTHFDNLSEIEFLTFVYRNANLQAGFFLLAARSCGLDCGPMSGFSNAKVDDLFFKHTSWGSNFLVNLGYGIQDRLYPRSPRLDFHEVCKII